MNVTSIYQMSCRFINAIKLAQNLDSIISRTSQIKANYDGMREESLDLVRKQRALNLPDASRPIEVNVWPDLDAPVLSDGRHRLTVARELHDPTINAIIRYFDEEADIVDEQYVTLLIDD